MSTLTDKEELFCKEYLIDLCGTKAAMRAGISPDNERSAGTQAWRLLKKVEIQKRIKVLMDERGKRVSITADRVLEEMGHVGFSDIAELYDEMGNLLPIDKIPVHARRAIASIEVEELWDDDGESKIRIGNTKKIKLWDKTKGLEMLGRHFKMFTDVIEDNTVKNRAERLKKARERAAKAREGKA